MIAKNQKNDITPDFSAGEVILIDKEKGYSSFNAVHKVRRALQVKKVGHAGTLDPAATGLLILCTGKKTKEISSYQGMKKLYSGIITLGKKTSSMDGESEVIEEKSTEEITSEKVFETSKLFLGNIKQIPPMYSALKYKGARLYKLARKGLEVKREPREVTVYSFIIKNIDLPHVFFEVECSKGTYIRVLANDFGDKLGCGAYLSELRREKIGDFDVREAYTTGEFEEFFGVGNNNKSSDEK